MVTCLSRVRISAFLTTVSRRQWFPLFLVLLSGCFSQNDPFLDPSIPRVVTPSRQIAFVRTKWLNKKLQQTTFLDKQYKVLEDFTYGYSNEKILNQYKGDRLITATHYYHSDSSPAGYIHVIERRFDCDQTGRVVHVRFRNSEIDLEGKTYDLGLSNEYYEYKSPYDTLIRQMPSLQYNSSEITNINRWERNRNGQLVRNFRLYVLTYQSRPDTIYYYSHRFSYDTFGRCNLSWYDVMYLDEFYYPAGPDTIHYSYGHNNQPVREEHKYTLDRRNKREIDRTSLSQFDRESADRARQRFFIGDSIVRNNQKTNLVEYRYEPFDPAKHLPLRTSQDVGY